MRRPFPAGRRRLPGFRKEGPRGIIAEMTALRHGAGGDSSRRALPGAVRAPRKDRHVCTAGGAHLKIQARAAMKRRNTRFCRISTTFTAASLATACAPGARSMLPLPRRSGSHHSDNNTLAAPNATVQADPRRPSATMCYTGEGLSAHVLHAVQLHGALPRDGIRAQSGPPPCRHPSGANYVYA